MPPFVFASSSGKKISLERATHACPRCKNKASVQLMRCEKQVILFNKRITDNTTVRYECSQCRWKNEELPYDPFPEFSQYLNDCVLYPTPKSLQDGIYH